LPNDYLVRATPGNLELLRIGRFDGALLSPEKLNGVPVANQRIVASTMDPLPD
jgi:hypothetical protein